MVTHDNPIPQPERTKNDEIAFSCLRMREWHRHHPQDRLNTNNPATTVPTRTGRFACAHLTTLTTGDFQVARHELVERQTVTLICAVIRHIQVKFGQAQRAKPKKP
jgi:hypothetical protein